MFTGAREEGKTAWKKSHTHLAVDEKTGLHRKKALFDVTAAAIACMILRLDGHTTVSTQPPHRKNSYLPVLAISS
jgi:hypothetical protein